MSKDLKTYEAVFTEWKGLECRLVTIAFDVEDEKDALAFNRLPSRHNFLYHRSAHPVTPKAGRQRARARAFTMKTPSWAPLPSGFGLRHPR